jgi:hypothetical protein
LGIRNMKQINLCLKEYINVLGVENGQARFMITGSSP